MIVVLIVGTIIGIVIAEVIILVGTLFYDNVLCRPEEGSRLVRASEVQKIFMELKRESSNGAKNRAD
jgi:hypothetical protein